MSSALLNLIFDGALAMLLVATIAYCAKLSRRIKMLQDGRSELAGMIAQFDTATNRAMASVNELQTISKKITDALQLKIEKANFLADDLAFLIEKSNKLVLQLEQVKLPSNEHMMGNHKYVQKASEPKLAANHPLKHKQSLENIFRTLTPSEIAVSDRLEQSSEPRVVPRTGAERELLAALKQNR